MLPALLAAVLSTVIGHVTADGSPVPGVEVSIGSAKAITDAQGAYTIAVSPGDYDIHFQLAGLTDSPQRIVVKSGENDAGVRPLRVAVVDEPLVIAEEPCGQSVTSVWDWPVCDDYKTDTALETAVKRGDHSAINLLEQRYETAPTLREKRRIAGILLNRVSDDSKYWKPLIDLAEDSLRFAGDDDAARARLKTFAEEKGIDPDAYLAATYDALGIVSEDVRSRDLLRRALNSNVPDLQVSGIEGFAMQRDESMLERIDAVIEKATQYQGSMAEMLALYRSDAADKIAFKYLSEDDRPNYLEDKQRLDDQARQDR